MKNQDSNISHAVQSSRGTLAKVMVGSILLVLFCTSCTFLGSGAFELELKEDTGQFPESLDISISGLQEDENKQEDVLYSVTNTHLQNGKLNLVLDFFKYKKIKVITKNQSLEKMYLPSITFFEAPKIWQIQELKKNIVIQTLKISRLIPDKAVISGQEIEKKEEVEQINIGEKEHEIADFNADNGLLKNYDIHQMFAGGANNDPALPGNNSEKYVSYDKIKQNLNHIKNKPLEKVKYNLYVYDKLGPIAQARVFGGRNTTQTIKNYGVTNSKGELFVELNPYLKPDVLIFKKDGFQTLIKPFQVNESKKILSVELSAGESLDVLTQFYAYGAARGFDKTQFFENERRVSVSNPFGFVSYHLPALPGSFAEASTADSSLSSFKLEQSASVQKTVNAKSFQEKTPNTEQFIQFILQSSKSFKPSIGFLETYNDRMLADDLLWRRGKREFFSRLMNDKNIKTIISDVVLKYIDGAGVTLDQVEQNGWAGLDFSDDLDFLIMIKDPEKNDRGFSFKLLVLNKNGQNIYNENVLLNSDNPEEIMSKIYKNVFLKIPFEGQVIGKEHGLYKINLGKKEYLSVGDKLQSYASGENFTLPLKKTKVFEVVEVSDDFSFAKASEEKGKVLSDKDFFQRVEKIVR